MPGRQSWCGKEVPLPYEMSECRRARFQNRLEQALATLCFASHRSVEALPEAPAGPMFKASQRGAQIGHSGWGLRDRSEEHTSELQSLMRISYAVFCLKKKITTTQEHNTQLE